MTLYGKVQLTDPGGTLRTLGSENLGFTLELDEELAHKATVDVSDPSSVFDDLYVLGSTVEIFCDSSNPPTSKVFKGYLEEREVKQPAKTRRILSLVCNEYFHVVAAGIQVAERYVNKKAGVIVKDLFSRYASEFNTVNVQDTDVTVEEVVLDYMSLLDAVDELAKLGFAQYYVDPALNVYFYPRRTMEDLVTIQAASIRLGGVVRESVVDMKNKVTVLGGFSKKPDQQQTTAASYVALDTKHRAASFTPKERSLMKIDLYLEKIGSPSSDLVGRIVEDVPGFGPTGTRIAGLMFRRDDVSAAGWYSALLDEVLRTEKKHWIIVDKNGDASNTFRWSHDNGATGENAESTDGSTWTVNANSFKFAFKSYYGEPVIEAAVHSPNLRTYKERADVVVDRSISDKDTAKRLALSKLTEESKVWKTVSIPVDLSSLPLPGRRVVVNYPALNLSSERLVTRKVSVGFEKGRSTVEEAVLELVN